MSIYQNFNSTGSSSSYSSISSSAEKTRQSQNHLSEIWSSINKSIHQLYNLVGFNGVIVTSSTFNKDMNTIQKQVNFIFQRRNKQYEVYLKEQLLVFYDRILEQKHSFLKRMDYIRKYNLVSPQIVKLSLAIEKYFEITTELVANKDEEDFDSLEIPSELF